MKGTGAGWDSCLYRILIVGGFLAVIGGTVFTAVTQPPDSKLPIYVGVGTAAAFMVLIVGYWALQIFFKGYGSLKAADLTQKADRNDLSILQNWNSLFAAMITEAGDQESMKRSARKGNSNLMIWFAWAAVIALCPIMLMVPYAFGFVDWPTIRYGVMFYIGIVILMSLLTVVFLRTGTKAAEDVLLAPLGLKLAALPQVVMMGAGQQVRGATVMEGTRFGRAIEIRVALRRVVTMVRFSAPAFAVASKSGSLEAGSDAPQAVANALRPLRKAKRWEGLEIDGDGANITATRDSKGQNMWLYDLWLIERIIDEFEKGRGA